MKRKDWISLVMMSLIVGIALIGEQFIAKGDWLQALASLSLKLLPLLIFFVFAVVARNRRGSYVQFWRISSYVSFAAAVVCLLLLSFPFMHYFNVMSSKDKVSHNTTTILDQCDNMFKSYENQVESRIITYKENVKSAYDGNSAKMDILKKKDNTATSYRSWPDEWQVNMFRNHSANKKQFSEQRADFENALTTNFNPFQAAYQFDQLITQFDSYKKLLSDDYTNLTPFEEDEKLEMTFETASIQQVSDDTLSVFTEPKFNIPVFLAYLVLAFFASASYIFFKDSTVRRPAKNKHQAEVYDKGFKL